MKNFRVMVHRAVFVLALLLSVGFDAHAEFSKVKLRELVEPIALYPDPLLFQILPAATFPDQIVDAGLLIKGKSDAALVEQQSWDESVKAVANYPGVLKQMNADLQWTKDLGNAFLEQDEELLDTIQELRGKAKELGNLESGDEQVVKTEKAPGGAEIIVIEPSSPQVIYVPVNTTTVVYTEPRHSTTTTLAPLVTLGLGVAIGAAIDDDDDDYHYHGYYGGGYRHWYDHSYHDKWRDKRWDHVDDRREFRQDRVKEQQDFRNDRVKDSQDFRQDMAKDRQKNRGNYSKVSTLNKDQWNKSRDELQARRVASGRSAHADRGWSKQSAQSKVQSARSSYSSRSSSSRSSYSKTSRPSYSGSTRSTYASRARSSAFHVSGSRRQVSAARSRGAHSRSFAGRSRGGGGRRR